MPLKRKKSLAYVRRFICEVYTADGCASKTVDELRTSATGKD